MYKNNWKSKKTSGGANLVEGNNAEMNQSDTATGAPLFTSAQYAKNLKLLGNSSM